MQSAVNSSNGHYSFRFSNPGTFTLTVTLAAVYQAEAGDGNGALRRDHALHRLSLAPAGVTRMNFAFSHSSGMLPGRALGGGAPGERFG
jgi:hypothetical protein